MMTPTATTTPGCTARGPDIKVLVHGHASPTSGQTILAEQFVTAAELRDGRFEAELDARARAEGWCVTHLTRRTPEDIAAHDEVLQLAAEFGASKATGAQRALLQRFLTGEVTENLVLALGRAVREGAGHPATQYALNAAERDAYRVFWRVRLGPASAEALTREAETWAEMALGW